MENKAEQALHAILEAEEDPNRRRALCRLVLNEYDRQFPEFERRMKAQGMTDDQVMEAMKGYHDKMMAGEPCKKSTE